MHAAHRIHRRRRHRRRRDFEHFDRLEHILESHRSKPDTTNLRVAQDARNARGAENLPPACMGGNPGRDVQRRAEITPGLLHGGSQVDSNPDAEEQRLVLDRLPEAKRRADRAARIVADDEDLVPDTVDQTHAGAECAGGQFRISRDRLRGLGAAVCFGQSGIARKISDDEGVFDVPDSLQLRYEPSSRASTVASSPRPLTLTHGARSIFRAWMVGQAQRLGLRLSEIAQITAQRRSGSAPCGRVRRLLEDRTAELAENAPRRPRRVPAHRGERR